MCSSRDTRARGECASRRWIGPCCVERYAREGRILNPDQFKKEEGEIWSFKRDQNRIPCFLRGQRVILTHVFTKKRQRWPRREFQRAERIMNEHLTQEMGGWERKGHEI